MTQTSADWVIGRGLLGRALATRIDGPEPFRVAVPWDDDDAAISALLAGTHEFLSRQSDNWRIYWSAGRGVTSTRQADLEREVRVFGAFLDGLRRSSNAHRSAGQVFLASSVGGAYSGRSDPPFSEATLPLPSSDYGRAKLTAEAMLTRWCAATGHRGLVGRITNLYGPGQDLGKGQGLISTVIRSYIAQTPTSIWVSLDTLRDYIYVDDCAAIIVAGMDRLSSTEAGSTTTKVIGSLSAVSVGEILGETRRLLRGRAPITLGGGSAAGHAEDLSVVSRVWPDLNDLARTTLPAGIHATYLGLLKARIDPGGRPHHAQ